MASSDVQRKLTAILSADVLGYSHLMGDDEAATVETITTARSLPCGTKFGAETRSAV